jgi:hypothetical protein
MRLRELFFIASFLVTASFAYAVDADAVVEIAPANPAPYSSATLTLTSYSFNVSTAMITWSISGKELSSGLGKKQLVVRTGAAGQQIPIKVTAKTADGGLFETTQVIMPESVDLLYETPESFVPPFYEGRSLPSEGAVVRVTAIPTISEGSQKIPAGSLSYTWYVNDEVVENASGAGRQVLTVPMDYITEVTTVGVLVTSPRGARAENKIDIYPHAVIPAVYAYDAVLGTNLSRIIRQRFETTTDFTLQLVPYFLSARAGLERSAIYTWLLDDSPITPIGGQLLSLSPKKGSYGSRTLSIIVDNSLRKLQEARTDLDLIFDTR